MSHTIGITVAQGNTVILESTLWSGNVLNWNGAGIIITGTNNFTGSPAFVNTDVGNYHLTAESVAIDRGVNVGVIFDIDGQNRDSKPDLGADEVVAVQSVYCPLILKN